MDLKMPVMNGIEATKKIKEFRADIPIVAQTAYTAKTEKDEAFSAGCIDFISKPINEKTLYGVINKYLIKKRNYFFFFLWFIIDTIPSKPFHAS